MNPTTFGSRIANKFQKAFPKLLFKRNCFDSNYPYYDVTYLIEYDNCYFGLLIIYNRYEVDIHLTDIKYACAKTPKDRIKIFQAIHERCAELDL